ncbi:MAG TPA: hypothetical protein VMF69_13100 [Gemmataceae bacterium]|nr:hypothetical protein [Gemmataceae bacterium]
MRASLDRVACVLVLGVALFLSGCQKKKAASQAGSAPNQRQVAGPPQGNPVLPRPGQQLQSGGVVQNVRQAARRTVDLAQLKNFSLAYFQYQLGNGQGPSRVEDIKDSLDANTIAAFKEGTCVAVWGLRNLTSSTVVAYVKDPDSSGTRIVATGDGAARRMNQQDFDAAMKAK